jgi:hypothetical protein
MRSCTTKTSVNKLFQSSIKLRVPAALLAGLIAGDAFGVTVVNILGKGTTQTSKSTQSTDGPVCTAGNPGRPVIAIATIGLGAAGNRITAEAKCSSSGNSDVDASATAIDPGTEAADVMTGEGQGDGDQPTCVRTYTAVADPASTWSVSCIFY